MKRGLEILGIGIIDIDSRDCMMLRAEQTPDKAYMEKQGEDYNLVDWYLDVLRKYRDKLLGITRYIVADAWFSKAKFVGEACLLGFHVISRLRDDAALWYSHNGVRTGKRGRPRIKDEKIDFEKLDLQCCEILDIEEGRAYSVKAYSKGFLFKEIRGLYSCLVDDIIQTKYTSAPSIKTFVEKTDNSDDERFAVYKWQRKVCFLMNKEK